MPRMGPGGSWASGQLLVIRAAEQQTPVLGSRELAAIVKDAKACGDIDALHHRLTMVSQKLPDEPGAADAEQGLQTQQELALVRELLWVGMSWQGGAGGG